MAQLGPDIALFLGDLPYTKQGRLEELREMHKKIRFDAGFLHLTSSTPTFAIWDDHDFGPDDTDGTHPYAAEALGGFKEWWPNPSYGLPGTDGIFTSVRWGDAEIFLLDDRFHQRQPPSAPALLGEQQLRWLLEGLASSTARYKVIVSGTQFGRTKRDAWAAPHHVKEREASGSSPGHRQPVSCSCPATRTGWRSTGFRSDRACIFTTLPPHPSENAWSPRMTPTRGWARSSTPTGSRNLFCELELRPAADRETALVLRVYSGADSQIHKLTLSPADLGL